MTIRILAMSDQHLEFEQGRHFHFSESWSELDAARKSIPGHPELGPLLAELAGAVDIALCPGDINNGTKGIKWLGEVAAFLEVPVLYVAGNELYDGVEIGKTLADMMAMAAKAPGGAQVHVLENERADFVISGRCVAVLGTTLWTDYCLNRESQQAVAMDDAERALNDHRRIRYAGRRLRPQDALELHQGARAWLASAIPTARAEADVLVVMTHHAPTPAANPPQYQGGKLSPAFASNMEVEVRNSGADLWISGHTHWNHDLTFGRTRCFSHQRGYIGMDPEDVMPPAEEFVPLVVEI